ncbi:MAG: alpha-2-macroglobulin family protein [Calditrichia bacterium]
MKRILITALLLTVFAGVLYSNNWQDDEMKEVKKGPGYEKEWKEVEQHISKNLPQSALKVINDIYAKAKKDKNSGQVVKALIYRLRMDDSYQEDPQAGGIYLLEKELAASVFPEKNVLTSMLAQSYWQYYQNNRWNILERTTVEEPNVNDIRTWDAKQLVERTIELYETSMEKSDELKRLYVEVFDDVIIKQKESRTFRPTLFDFLAHRAIDFYMNSESGLTRPAEQFHLSDETLFGSARNFAAAKVESPEENALHYYALKLLQNTVRFHLRDESPEALVDIDLKRLKFINQHGVMPNKDELYLKALQNLEKAHADSPISTDVSYEIAQYYFSQSSEYRHESEAHKWDRKTAYEILQKAITRFPESSGAHNCRVMQDQIKAKQLSLNLEQVNLPDMPFRGLVSYQNVPKVYLKAIIISPEELEQKRNSGDRMNQDAWIKWYLSKEVVATWSVDLPDDGDYHTHSVEIKMPALAGGNYVFLMGTTPEFSTDKQAVATAPTWVSRLGMFQKSGDKKKHRFVVVDRHSGQPLSGVTATLWKQKYNQSKRRNEMVKHATKKTDRNGEFLVKSGSRADRFRVDLKTSSDRLFLDDFYNNAQRYRNRGNRKHTTTHFFTDRSIYRPGQTVFFKGILLDFYDAKPFIAKKRSTTVTLYDVNQQKVSDLKLTSNEYGTVSGSFVLPNGSLNGQMSLHNENGSSWFSMEEYKRPRFEVTFNPIEGSFRLDDKVKVSGKATAYAGSNIDNASVAYRVVRAASFPYYGYWWKPAPSSPAVEILNGISKTDANGAFEIDFTALADPTLEKKDKPIFNYTVYADITDISGETRSATATVRVGYVALDVQLNVPGVLNRNSLPEWAITTNNLNGEFEAASGDITIHRLDDHGRVLRPRLWQRPDRFMMDKTAYVKDFPNDVYDREDDFRSWEPGKRYLSQQFNTDRYKKLRLEKLSSWPEGNYVVELNTKDAFGEDINIKKYFTMYDLREKDIPGKQFNWQAAEKLVGEPGGKATYAWGSAAKDLHALVEVYKKEGIHESRWERATGKRTLSMPIAEEDRGGFGFSITWIRYGRLTQISNMVQVPWSNKELSISYETFRDKLKPGQEEEWRLKIRGHKGEKLAAEMLAGMYDASLDAFAPHSWNFSIYGGYSFPYYLRQINSGSNFTSRNYSANGRNWNYYGGLHHRTYDQLDFYPGSNMMFGSRARLMSKRSMGGIQADAPAPTMMMEGAAPAEEAEFANADAVQVLAQAKPAPAGESKERNEEGTPADNTSGAGEPQVRKNLSETAFFFPHLQTNAEGEIILSFTVPEALTRWKLMGLAHTKNLEFGMTQNEIVTQKELMVLPNAPRFMRDGDKMTFSAKVSNLSEKALSGTAELQLFDALNMKPIDNLFGNKKKSIAFSAPAGQSDALMWDIKVPADIDAVTYRVIAKAGNFSDGEESTLPVLTNRMLVTETLPLPVRGKGTTSFKLEKLVNNKSKTLKHKRLTLEFTSNPAWYAIQALPYLMEYPYECSEQTFSRFYANSIAAHIANSNPKIKRVFDSWKQSGDALASNLEKNQELKSLLLQETPWVLQAQDESERKKRVGLLFDLNNMSRQLETAKRKLQQMQLPSGAWPWFTDMRPNRYLTQHIVAGFGHLDRLEISTGAAEAKAMAQNAIRYLDEEMNEDYMRLLEHKVNLKDNHLSSLIIHYLYARSYFMQFPVQSQHQKAFDYWKSQAQQYWVDLGQVYREGMIALALHRLDDKKTPADIIASLKERALHSNEMGMYWRSKSGYFWYQAPIETQALLIELFDEVANDRQAVNDMRIWLLKQKQTQDWKTTKATVEACYALLLRGSEWLADDRIVEVSLGGEKVDISSKDDTKPEAGTGYFKTAWTGSDIKQDMGNVTVTKQTEGVAWGGLYWQYFEDLDKITPHETPLKLKKELFLEQPSATGPVLKKLDKQTLKPGDLIKVRIELRVDRTMEYVHMKDMRAAGLEPINVISQSKYQGGLGYYESTKDASTNFFFGWLPKGTYVFEYPLRVTHEGNFSNGITTIQCMYAPEFTSHSEGIRIAVGK